MMKGTALVTRTFDILLGFNESKKDRWDQIDSDCDDAYRLGLKKEKEGDFTSAEVCFIRSLNAKIFSRGASDFSVFLLHLKLARLLDDIGKSFDAGMHYMAAYN